MLLAFSQVAGHGKYRYYSSKSTGKYYSSNNRGYSSSSGGYSSNNRGYSSSPRQSRQAGNIVEELTNNGASTLIDLAVKAGLADTLTGGGPYTIFAPTNAAFAALPTDLVSSLTSDVEMLKKVLLYHVVPGTVTSDQARNGISLKTVEGTSVKINVYKNWKYVGCHQTFSVVSKTSIIGQHNQSEWQESCQSRCKSDQWSYPLY